MFLNYKINVFYKFDVPVYEMRQNIFESNTKGYLKDLKKTLEKLNRQ